MRRPGISPLKKSNNVKAAQRQRKKSLAAMLFSKELSNWRRFGRCFSNNAMCLNDMKLRQNHATTIAYVPISVFLEVMAKPTTKKIHPTISTSFANKKFDRPVRAVQKSPKERKASNMRLSKYFMVSTITSLLILLFLLINSTSMLSWEQLFIPAGVGMIRR